MRAHPPYLLALLALAAPPLLSCDNLTAGQIPEDPGPPVLMKLLIQDELPRGGRNAATDLLDRSPTVACSEREPCPSGDHFSFPSCNYDAGTCPVPLRPTDTPPAIGLLIAGTTGGNQIRIVLNKLLDPAIEVPTINMMTGQITGYALKDPSIVGVYDAQGRELAALKYWDPTGSPTITSDLFLNPYGPALVVKPKAPFALLTSYSIRVKPEAIKDPKGQALGKDVHGQPVATSYEFTTEGFHPWGGQLFEEDFKGAIDPKDALVLKTNARMDPATLKVEVKKGGQPVEIVAALEFGTEPKSCAAVAANAQQINIFRVSGENRVEWTEGEDYTVSVEVKAADLRSALFARDPFGTIPYKDVPFGVRKDLDKTEAYLAKDLLTPWECASGGPPDMSGGDLATPPDLLVGGDMAMPPGDGGNDLAMPDDGGADMAVPPADGGAGG